MAHDASKLPHWDLSDVYPGLHSAEFQSAFHSFVEMVQALTSLFDTHAIGRREPSALTGDDVGLFDRVIGDMNAFYAHATTVSSYVYSFVSTDARDDFAQAKLNELQQHLMRGQQLAVRLAAWIGCLDVDTLRERSAVAREHAYFLTRARVEAAHHMSPHEEALAIELNLTGGNAWGLLHQNVCSRLMVDAPGATTTSRIPISEVRNLAFDSDRETRKRAYHAELLAWEQTAVPLAAAFNGIKGEDLVLLRRRGWQTPLAAALFHNHVDQATLDSLMTAAIGSFPMFRRYLKAKARALGLTTLAWYDVEAPIGSSTRVWTYDDARDFIAEQFGTFSHRLRALADRAFTSGWIDAEPREGKVDGGFCMPLIADQSRILVNYMPAFDGVSTLAHELGHAYHVLALAEQPALLRETPSTLAETASIFCETIIRQAGQAHASSDEQLALLDASIGGQLQVVVDITSRFLFERRAFEARAERELSVEELNALMLDAQRETYGDALDPTLLHPYMWAVKPHYYTSWYSFYNFPYMFGSLFGLGLYARYKADPAPFIGQYDALLAATGRADAAELAKRFDIDIASQDFWNASLGVIGDDIERFIALVDRRFPQ